MFASSRLEASMTTTTAPEVGASDGQVGSWTNGLSVEYGTHQSYEEGARGFRPGSFVSRIGLCYFLALGVFLMKSSRDCSAREAPMAVVTFLRSSGGGRTAVMPSDSNQSSRAQPCVW